MFHINLGIIQKLSLIKGTGKSNNLIIIDDLFKCSKDTFYKVNLSLVRMPVKF